MLEAAFSVPAMVVFHAALAALYLTGAFAAYPYLRGRSDDVDRACGKPVDVPTNTVIAVAVGLLWLPIVAITVLVVVVVNVVLVVRKLFRKK